MSRTNKQKQLILDNLDNIRNWKATGATITQIRQQLNISDSSWYRYTEKLPELQQAIEQGDSDLSLNLKKKIYLLAMGEAATTTIKTVYKITDTGQEVVSQKEVIEKKEAPNITALLTLLRNYDKDFTDNPQLLQLKKEQLEILKNKAGIWEAEDDIK